MPKTRILMICLGNICRSPLAEAVMRDLIQQKNLAEAFEVDSAGTSGFHVGKLPDPRSIQVACKQGISLHHRGRQLKRGDLELFDHILVMDQNNFENTLKLAKCDEERSKVELITKYDGRSNAPQVVADPYWGELQDFQKVLEQLTFCCEGFLKVHAAGLSKKSNQIA